MECPTCGRMLNTERGMKQHHTMVHDEPLPNRECKGCGTAFYDPKSRLKYCDDCDSNAGKHNGNYKDAKETTECERCSDEFEYYPSDKKGVYCPTCVEEADDFLGDGYQQDIEPVERECEYCEKQFEILPCFIRNGGGKFCDWECYVASVSSDVDCPNVYNGDWWGIKEQALERDHHRCQNCGKGPDEIGRNPDVHHIKPVREFEDPQAAHTIENVVTLCRSCHVLAERGEIPEADLRP